tara:strand:- start:286 stop:588 length:303 start_codon:yes stop_codon:yes gene_type:complete
MADYEKPNKVGFVGLKKNEEFFKLNKEEQKESRQPVYKGYFLNKEEDKFYDVALWVETDAEKVGKGFFLNGSITEQFKKEEQAPAQAPGQPGLVDDDIPF